MRTGRHQGQAGRHRAIVVLLLVHVPVLWVLGARAGWTLTHAVSEVVLPLLGFAALAWFARHPRLAAGAGALGLMYVSAVVVHVAGGVTEAHFYFFVAFGLVALYRDWLVFFAAAAFAVGHHVLLAFDGGLLFAQPYQLERPLFWAAVHVSFVTVVTAVQGVGMYDVARSVTARTAAETAVQRSEERRRTALELHDNVVQALATANYARSLGEDEMSGAAVSRALAASQELVAELLADSAVDEHMLLRREPAPSEV
ncbi:hypothetical protein [Egicoccus sp. AB-alg6-2]|uniref:hypothetical protein n=1 Tax=Egicoccus sp. AB-alg6-2 TaxID=3242692 RepID=UPI00359D636E